MQIISRLGLQVGSAGGAGGGGVGGGGVPTCKPNREMICMQLYDSCMRSPAFD